MKPYIAKRITVEFVRFTQQKSLAVFVFSYEFVLSEKFRRCAAWLKIIPQFPFCMEEKNPNFLKVSKSNEG